MLLRSVLRIDISCYLDTKGTLDSLSNNRLLISTYKFIAGINSLEQIVLLYYSISIMLLVYVLLYNNTNIIVSYRLAQKLHSSLSL
jgi:hypothetical protein